MGQIRLTNRRGQVLHGFTEFRGIRRNHPWRWAQQLSPRSLPRQGRAKSLVPGTERRAWRRADNYGRSTASRISPCLRDAFMVILGLEHFEQFPDIVRHHEAGTIPPTVMWGCCPTHFDPSQAPAGKHTAFMWEKLPFRLRGNSANWDLEKENHGR